MLLCADVHLYCIGSSLLECVLRSYTEIDVEENSSASESILSKSQVEHERDQQVYADSRFALAGIRGRP